MENLHFDFEPVFYLLDKNPYELRSVAVEKVGKHGYEGVVFKESNLGWEVNPFKIGKGYIANSNFDFTENFEEAKFHASLKNEPA